MRKRSRMTKRHSKRLFRKTASRTHKRNLPHTHTMRGGIRL